MTLLVALLVVLVFLKISFGRAYERHHIFYQGTPSWLELPTTKEQAQSQEGFAISVFSHNVGDVDLAVDLFWKNFLGQDFVGKPENLSCLVSCASFIGSRERIQMLYETNSESNVDKNNSFMILNRDKMGHPVKQMMTPAPDLAVIGSFGLLVVVPKCPAKSVSV